MRNKKVFFMNCGAHAREWVSPATCMYIIKQVCEFSCIGFSWLWNVSNQFNRLFTISVDVERVVNVPHADVRSP